MNILVLRYVTSTITHLDIQLGVFDVCVLHQLDQWHQSHLQVLQDQMDLTVYTVYTG